MNKRIELITLLDECTKSKNKIKSIKDETLRILVESIINSKKSKEILMELKK